VKLTFYSPAPRHPLEETRQCAVDASGFAALIDDPALTEIVRRAIELFDAPMAAISIVDRDRQWFPAEIGIGARDTSRAASFCAHAILTPDRCFSVGDASLDPRFAGNPLVLSGPNIRFYAGAPLRDGGGLPLGALCVLDDKARVDPHPDTLAALQALAREAVAAAAGHRDRNGARPASPS
jgi:GAF domain-containing protein